VFNGASGSASFCLCIHIRSLFPLQSAHRREPTARKLSSYLGYAVSVMDSGSLYKDDGTSASSDLDGLDITDLEASAQELVLPFIRIAALVRHYVFEQDLPSIAEDANEFSGLIDFLELTNNKVVEEDEAMETEGAAIAVVSVADGLNWFRVAAEEGGQLEMDLWLQEFVPHIRRNCAKAKQLLQVNLLWSQPVLLRVPKNYDDIFQVRNVTCHVIKRNWHHLVHGPDSPFLRLCFCFTPVYFDEADMKENLAKFSCLIKRCVELPTVFTHCFCSFLSVLPQAKVQRVPERAKGPNRLPHVRSHGLSEGGLLQNRGQRRR
jgi:hypothetical protein